MRQHGEELVLAPVGLLQDVRARLLGHQQTVLLLGALALGDVSPHRLVVDEPGLAIEEGADPPPLVAGPKRPPGAYCSQAASLRSGARPTSS